MPTTGDILDGYELLRPIGEGGFGQVWLCRSAAMGDLRALKFIRAENGSALDKEHEAVSRYRRAAAQLRSPGLTPIEHVNRWGDGLFYVMPLADGEGATSPEAPDWRPRTLGSVLEGKRSAPGWLTSREVVSLMEPVLAGLQCLADTGLVHRDIKPENILFFGGKPCLGDISLLTEDRTQITRHGTPGYSTPSWFMGGHHDMYGAAALLYSLLTGNDPDRMGRSAFRWPPQGESSLSPQERTEWLRLHAVVRRATEERPGERYADFQGMLQACRPALINSTALTRLRGPALVPRWTVRTAILMGGGSLFAWSMPVIGAPMGAVGLLLALRARSPDLRKSTLTAAALNGIGLLLCIVCAVSEVSTNGVEPHVAQARGASASVPHQNEYDALIAEDKKNIEECRSNLDAHMRGLTTAVNAIRERLRATLNRGAIDDAFEKEVDAIRAATSELLRKTPKSGFELHSDAVTRSRSLITKASSLPQSAEEEFYFRKEIVPHFAEGAHQGNELLKLAKHWSSYEIDPAKALEIDLPNELRRLVDRVSKAGAEDEATEKRLRRLDNSIGSLQADFEKLVQKVRII